MTLETLQRANGIKKAIDRLELEKSKVSKFYSKRDDLTPEQIEELIQIAMINTDYALKVIKEALDEL